jgi:hypothetical protein
MFHQAQLAGLVEHGAQAVDRHRAGGFDEFGRVLFQYSRTARKLWGLLERNSLREAGHHR